MKKLLVTAFAVLALSGCSVLAPKFDNVEYDRFVELTAAVQYVSLLCGQPILVRDHARVLVEKAKILDLYATHRPAHKEIKEITSLILANLKEMNTAYWRQPAPSSAYCLGKLKIIENSLKRALPAIGGLMQ